MEICQIFLSEYRKTGSLNLMILNKMNLSFENIQNFSKYDNKYCKLVYNMMVSPIDVYNLREVKFDALKEPMNLKVPSFEYGWHIEGDNGI